MERSNYKLLKREKLQLAVFASLNILANNNFPLNRALASIGNVMNTPKQKPVKSVYRHILQQIMGPFYDFLLLWPELIIQPKKTALKISSGELELEKALKLTAVSFLVPLACIQFLYPEYKTENSWLNILYSILPAINAMFIFFALKYVLKTKNIGKNDVQDLTIVCVATAAASPFYFLLMGLGENPPPVHIVLFSSYFGLLAKHIYKITYMKAYRIACSAQFLVLSFPLVLVLFHPIYLEII
jgi:hypothetical protein